MSLFDAARQAERLLAAVEDLPPAHRCPGLTRCGNHPRWRVAVRRGTPSVARSTLYPLRITAYHVFRPHATIAEAVLLDHAEAMDLATERAEQLAAIAHSEGIDALPTDLETP